MASLEGTIFKGNPRLSLRLVELIERYGSYYAIEALGELRDLLRGRFLTITSKEGIGGFSANKRIAKMIRDYNAKEYGFNDAFWEYVEPTDIIVHRIDQNHLTGDGPRPVTCKYGFNPIYDHVLPKLKQNLLTCRYLFSFQFDIFYQWGDHNLRCYHPSIQFAEHFIKILEPFIYKFVNLRYYKFLNVYIYRHTYFSDGKQFAYKHRRAEYCCNVIGAINKKFNILTMACRMMLVNQQDSLVDDDFMELFARLEDYYAKYKQPIGNCYFEVIPLLGEERIYKDLPKKPVAKYVAWAKRGLMYDVE